MMSSRRENGMMKRSDFAQKLLDDLRLRKERLAVSQSSGHKNPLAAADRYAFSNGGFKGSKEIKSTNGTSFQGLKTQNRYSGGNTSVTKFEASNQIVAFERGRTSEKNDLSKVLAFALENAGKATRIDPSSSASIINFLHQIGRRSMNYGRRERRGSLGVNQPSSSQLPMIHVHIKEISKGTQKLNQIIKACSSGLGFGGGRTSLSYGKELMQGAIELEQSLRMLVDIQEGSESMTKSEEKNQIKLIDSDDEDDVDATVKRRDQMQLELPRLSFDRHAKADIKSRLSALAYPEDDNINRRQTPSISRVSSHRRSASYSPGEVDFSRFTEGGRQLSSSKPGERRIPNVIAKLMGLGEFPKEEENMKYKEHKESTLKTKIENGVSIKSAMPDDTKAEPWSKDVDKTFQNTRQRAMQANKVAALENLVAMQAGNKLTPENTNLNLVIYDKTQAKNAKKDKVKSEDIWEKEREEDAEDDRSNNAVKGEEGKGLSYNNESQRMSTISRRPSPPVTVEFQKEKKYKPSAPVMENNRRTGKLSLRSRKTGSNNLGFDQPIKVDNSESPEAKNRGEEQKKNNEREKPQRVRQKANASVANHLPKPVSSSMDDKKKPSLTKKPTSQRKNPPEVDVALHTKNSPGKNHKSKPGDESFSFSPANGKDLNPKSSKDDSLPPGREPKSKDSESPPAFKEKLVHVQAAQKTKEGKVHKSEIPQKVNQAMTKQNGSLRKLTKPMKNRNSISKEETDRKQEVLKYYGNTKPMMNNKTKESEACSTETKVVAQDQTTIKDGPPLLIPKENGSQILKEVPSQSLANNRQEIVLIDGNDQQAPEFITDGDEALKSSQAVLRTSKGTRVNTEASSPTPEQPQKLPNRKIPEATLSESDMHLKKILVKSQLFLDAAEALFRLNIPLGILHIDENDCNPENSNLILDCGYEMMKRIGRRQELSIHPFVKVCIGPPRVKTLDDLIKQLSKAFEKLRSYGREGVAEPVVEDYLPKILERDVHFNDPDLNSMWDMGWSDSMLAFIEKDDVVRDMERYVLSGLVEEISRDLICI